MAQVFLSLPDREFFNIGEASRIVQLPEYTLRYWESKLKLLRPARRTSGHRRYTKRDLEIVLRVKELTKNHHMTLTGARKALLIEERGVLPPSGLGSSETTSPGLGKESLALSAKILREIRSDLKELLSDLA